MNAREKQLEVFIAGEHAGRLCQSPYGELSFTYDQSYRGADLSVDIPNSGTPYTGKRVLAWFDNLLPDDPQVRQGMAAEAGSSTGVFPLLEHFGLELPGAVQAVAPDGLSAVLYSQAGGYARISASEIAKRLRSIAESEELNRARAWAQSDEHWSLGGMQTKIALREWNGEWYECLESSASNVIVKPGAWGLKGQALVECLTMDLARKCGLPAASVRMDSMDGLPVLIAERFDRITSEKTGAVTRVHQEDLCQVLGVMSACKYANDGGPSSLAVVSVLKNAEGRSLQRFVDALLFNYLTASTDAHAKNYSVLHPEGHRFLLAPLYDVASAAPYLKKGKTYHTAMSIGGENRLGWLRKSSIERFAKAVGLNQKELANRTLELAESIKENLGSTIDSLSDWEEIDMIASVLVPRVEALCSAAQRNIICDSSQFKPVDITRYGLT